MTLREQIREIACRRVNKPFSELNFPTVVDRLAVMAFEEEWPEGVETRAIRHCLKLFTATGVIDNEPAVE